MKLKLNHDILRVSENILIATDNSGSIGEKEFDQVKIPYNRVAYYLFRVAYMESLAAGASPKAILLNNFNGDSAWEKLIDGLKKAFDELEIPMLTIEGSTESNFELKESATSLSIIGVEVQTESIEWSNQLKEAYSIAVIGEPFVGEEVVIHEEELPSLKKFHHLAKREEVLALIPVGSKGIESAIREISPDLSVRFPERINVKKSAGPATSYIVLYKKGFDLNFKKELEERIFKGSW